MANPELKWWHVRWGLWGRRLKKVGFWFAVVLAVGWTIDLALIGGLKLFGPYLSIRSLRNDPAAWIVPTPAPDITKDQLSGTRIEALGYWIQTPFGDQPVIHDGPEIASARFPSEGAIFNFENPTNFNGQAQSAKSELASVGTPCDQRRHLTYAAMAAGMAATPRDAAWWNPLRNQCTLEFLVNKIFETPELNAIYSVSGPEMRGFQFEGKRLSLRLVQLKLFDSADRQVDIEIFDGIGGRPTLTQAQINAMVASIRPVGQK